MSPEPTAQRDSAFDWAEPLLELPPILPVSAWTGHIPFLFLLFRLARPRTFVELGVYFGTSFIAGCEAARRFETETRCWGIDTWHGDLHAGFYDGDPIYQQLRSFIDERYRHCTLVRSTFDDAAAGFEPGTIDLLHIDGLHTYEAVAHDFATWLPKLSARSIVLFHDTRVRDGDFGAWKFWEEIKEQYRSLEFIHSFGLGVLMVGESVPPEFDRLLRQLEEERGLLDQFQAACESAGATLPARMQQRG